MQHVERGAPLASFAMQESQSGGRRYPEAEHPYRGIYQRDRDRILHAAAFRRLTAKTQVLVWGTNDHHRTRLTHTLEVSQVSRTMARQLQLNEDLTEAIALAHDIGHPPFGHAGEAALDECLQADGGFEHNQQGLRIVEELEQRYPTFPGLNLTWEVRESLAFHSKRPHAVEVKPYREKIGQPTLEAQVVDAADSVVYDVHDLDDAFGVNLITLEQVQELKGWHEAERHLTQQYGMMPQARLVPTILRYLLSWREREMLAATREHIRESGVRSVAEVKALKQPLVMEGPAVFEVAAELRQFLHEHVYQHPDVIQMASRGKLMVRELFNAYVNNPALMPALHAERAQGHSRTRAVGDYLSGMTDRLAANEYSRLFQMNEKLAMLSTLS